MQEYGISARLTFSNSLLRQEEHLTDREMQRSCAGCLRETENRHQNGVIMHSEIALGTILQEQYPGLYLVSSTTKVLTDFTQLEERNQDRKDFHYVVPDFRLNKAIR